MTLSTTVKVAIPHCRNTRKSHALKCILKKEVKKKKKYKNENILKRGEKKKTHEYFNGIFENNIFNTVG